jgi:hypothetical protein
MDGFDEKNGIKSLSTPENSYQHLEQSQSALLLPFCFLLKSQNALGQKTSPCRSSVCRLGP